MPPVPPKNPPFLPILSKSFTISIPPPILPNALPRPAFAIPLNPASPPASIPASVPASVLDNTELPVFPPVLAVLDATSVATSADV